MNGKKRRGSSLIFLIVFSFLSIFFLIFFAQITSAGCVSSPCYTALQRSSPSHPVPIPNQICAIGLPPHQSSACVDPVQDAERIQDLTACCQKSSGNPEGFITFPNRIRSARAMSAHMNFQVQCAPGMVRDDGFCNPGNPVLIDTSSPILFNKPESVLGGRIFCDANQVVCGVNLDETGFIDQVACCNVQQGIQIITPAVPEKISFDNVPNTVIRLCGEGKVVCGLDYVSEWVGRGNFMNHASGFYCCGVNNLQVQQSQQTEIPISRNFDRFQPNLQRPWIINSRTDKDANLFCYPNEVVCGAVGSSDPVVFAGIPGGSTKSFAKDLACCEVRQCSPEPNCQVPQGDANCNNQLDRDEAACQAVLRQDQERLQCGEQGFSLIEADGQALCCGNDGAEYFIKGTEACIDQQVLRAPGSGGGFREQNVILDFPGPMNVEPDLFTLGGEGTLIPLRERDARDFPLDNQYILEFDALVDGASDSNTKLIVRVHGRPSALEHINIQIPTTHTYPRYPTFHDKGVRFVRRAFSISNNDRTIKVEVQKQGTGLVRIRNLKIYHYLNRAYLFDDQRINICNSIPDFALEAANVMLMNQQLDQSLLDFTDQCGRANQFYCDATGVWRENTFNQDLTLKDAPTEEQLRLFGVTGTSSQGCCPSGSCWTGDRCVPAGEDTSAFTKLENDERQSLLCLRDAENAVWQSGIRKHDQYEDTSGFCSADQCWFNGERQAIPSPSECKESGERFDQEGIFCHNGVWKTRLTTLVETMLTIKDRNAIPEQYSLYCDDINNVLLDKEGKTAFWDAEVDTAFTGDEKACILDYNHATWSPNPTVNWLLSRIFAGKQPHNTILGILLKGDDQITDKIASDPDAGQQENVCAGAKAEGEKNRFFGCGQEVLGLNKLYYNEELNALIYSKEEPIRMEIP